MLGKGASTELEPPVRDCGLSKDATRTVYWTFLGDSVLHNKTQDAVLLEMAGAQDRKWRHPAVPISSFLHHV